MSDNRCPLWGYVTNMQRLGLQHWIYDKRCSFLPPDDACRWVPPPNICTPWPEWPTAPGSEWLCDEPRDEERGR